MATILNGTDLVLFHHVSGTTYTAFAGATSHTLTINAEAKQAATKDSGVWLEKIAGRMDWSISAEGLVSFVDSYSFEQMFMFMTGRTSIDVVFGIRTGSTLSTASDYYSGDAIITSLEMTAPDNESVTYSVTLEGTGELTRTNGA